MKRILTALLALVLTAGMLAGCTSNGKEASSGETPSSSSEARSSPQAEEPANSEDEEDPSAPEAAGGEGAAADKLIPALDYEAEIPTPDFLTEDQRLLYRAAYRMFYHFSMSGGFQPDMEQSMVGDNGFTFYLDNGFPSYSAFRAALDSVFTEDYAISLLNEYQYYMDDGNDRLFSVCGDRGSNITYVGSSFELVSQDENEMVFNLVGHYNEDAVYGEGGDPAKETTENFPIRMVKTGSGWRFDSFAMAN